MNRKLLASQKFIIFFILIIVTLIFTTNVTTASERLEQRLQSWNGPETSEEYPPAICPAETVVGGIHCKGKYCDNIKLKCVCSVKKKGELVYPTQLISEEYKKMLRCPKSRPAIVGFLCKGKYCDNVKLYCGKVLTKKWIQCKNTRWVSEENGGKLDFNYWLPVGMKCSGKYCDNKKFRICMVR